MAVDTGSQGASQLIKNILSKNKKRGGFNILVLLKRGHFQMLEQAERVELTMDRVWLNFLILATSSAENKVDTSLLICLTWQAIMIVLRGKGWKVNDTEVLRLHYELLLSLCPISPERPGGEPSLLAWQAAVRPYDLHSVSRFDHVHQVVVQDDVHRARQLAGGGFLRHLLHRDGLVILVDGQTELCLQGVVLLVLIGKTQEEVTYESFFTASLTLLL